MVTIYITKLVINNETIKVTNICTKIVTKLVTKSVNMINQLILGKRI